MDVNDAVKIVETFFQGYIAQHPEFWSDDPPGKRQILMDVQLVAVDGGEILVTFGIDHYEDDDDPKWDEIAKTAMAALEVAHPEVVPFGLSYELWDR